MKYLFIIISIIGIYRLFFASVRNDQFVVYPINLNVFEEIFIFIGLILMMTSNRLGYDALAYNRFFLLTKEYKINWFDYTYELLSKIVIATTTIFPEMTYYKFHALILAVIFLLLIYPTLRKHSWSVPAVLGIYVLSGSFAVDGMQFKNFIAVSFLIFAFSHLVSEKTSGTVMFYISIFFAILFHFSFAIYLFLPLVKNRLIKRYLNMIPIIGIITYGLFFLEGNFANVFLITLSKLPFLSKVAIYANQNAGIRSIFPVLIYLSILVLLSYCKKISLTFSDKQKQLVLISLHVWQLMGISLPALVFANAPYRIFRNLFLVLFIVISNSIIETPMTTYRRYKLMGITLVCIVLIYIYPVLLGSSVDIYNPIFNNPVLFWEE